MRCTAVTAMLGSSTRKTPSRPTRGTFRFDIPGEQMSTEQLERTLPTPWYRSPDIFQIEKERIFCREWLAVCREEELPGAGEGQVLDILGESILLVRNREGRIRAFYNVCRHRGTRLCRAADEKIAAGRVALPGGSTAGRAIV